VTFDLLRVYASFAEFKRAERDRLGLEAPPEPNSSCLTTLAGANLALASQAVPPAKRTRLTTACVAKPLVECAPAIVHAASASLRIYASFSEFERSERVCLMVPADAVPAPAPSDTCLTALVVANHAPSSQVTPPKRVRPKIPRTRLTPAALRAEGVLEIGRVTGTSMLYVRTRVKLYLMHQTWLPDRRLDDYAVRLAMNWLENHGLPSYEVASNLGVNDATLRQALLKAGYERALPVQRASRMNKKLKIGNRRGRFMRRGVDANEVPAKKPRRNFNGKSVTAARIKKKSPPGATWLR
jgi:hypothetical protein